MTRILLCALMFSLLIFAAKKERDWKTGKVADSVITNGEYTWGKATTTATTTGTVSPDYGAGSTVRGTTTATTSGPHHIPVKINTLIIVGDDYTYTAQEKKAGRGLCRVIVGDGIKYSQDKSRLYVLDADGKECRLDIVRQERRNN